jgi:DNA invertase Pin-like site-specific DNA recombinase
MGLYVYSRVAARSKFIGSPELRFGGADSSTAANRPGPQRLLTLINAGQVQAVIVAKLDRLTRSKELCNLLGTAGETQGGA